MGGVSRERGISLKSGEAVIKALRSAGFSPEEYIVDDQELRGIDPDNTDAAFIALHGRFGEDGGVQCVLEDRGVPYTGSPPGASALAMDKAASKEVFKKNGVPTPMFYVMTGVHDSVALRPVGFPCVVKPAREGSSIGVTIVRDPALFQEACEKALALDDLIVVEKFVPGREMTCAVLADRPLPIVEMKPAKEFYDYEAKYSEGSGTVYTLEHGLDGATVNLIQKQALAAHRALGCRGMSRVDLILDDKGEPHFLEVNTIPGMTDRSLLPMAAKAAGLDFSALCVKIVELALEA